jgi:hypothetical protein
MSKILFISVIKLNVDGIGYFNEFSMNHTGYLKIFHSFELF